MSPRQFKAWMQCATDMRELMFNTKRLIQAVLLALIGGFMFVPQALAYTCTTVTTSSTVTIPNMTVRRDVAVGSVIGTAISTGKISAFNCTDSAPASNDQKIGFKGYGTKSTQINGGNVYRLGPASTGIGYTISGQSVDCSGTYLLSSSNDILYSCGAVPSLPTQPVAETLIFTFYKIGDVAATSVPAQQLAGLLLQNSAITTQAPESAIMSSAFKVTSLGCTLTNTAISVPMGTVNSSNFSGTSYGSTMSAKAFSIPLTCDSGTAVTMQIDAGASGTVAYKMGVLQLDSATSGTAATGVGLQILRNGSPLVLGTAISIGTPSATGAFDIPLSARYFRSAATVTAGQANASATFTMTYN